MKQISEEKKEEEEEEENRPMAEQVKLFRTWSSPYALRVVWALKLKGVEYQTIFEDLNQKSPLLLQYNPVYKKVPVLVHGDKIVAESQVILEYVDGAWPGYPLMPEDPYERSIARFWAKFGDDQILPSLWKAFMKEGKEQENVMVSAAKNLAFVEEHLKGKKFFGGESIGFADLIFGCLGNLVSILEEVADIKILNADNFPSIMAWIHEFSQVPIIKENWPSRDQMVLKFTAMRAQYLAPK
ncbi:hypothetical protein QQ045_023141 [Rhodiola kirilowii]